MDTVPAGEGAVAAELVLLCTEDKHGTVLTLTLTLTPTLTITLIYTLTAVESRVLSSNQPDVGLGTKTLHQGLTLVYVETWTKGSVHTSPSPPAAYATRNADMVSAKPRSSSASTSATRQGSSFELTETEEWRLVRVSHPTAAS